MIITGDLAQQIVSNIMPLVQFNVNIMNDQGIIIGSGQKHRLNTFHKGAYDAIAGDKVVAIYPHQTCDYPGSLPGLNWPIKLGGLIVGVVGISGHPDQVSDTTKLVKMVTELILERESLMEQFCSQSHLQEQFALQLLSDQNGSNTAQLLKQARLLGFDLSLPRIVTIIDIRPLLEEALGNQGSFDLASLRARENLLQTLQTSPFISADDRLAYVGSTLVIFRHFLPASRPRDMIAWGENLTTYTVDTINCPPLPLAIGSLGHSHIDLHHSYNEAQYALNLSLGTSIHTIYDFNILASYLVKDPTSLTTCQAFQTLREQITTTLDCRYDMKNTLVSLMNNDLNLSATAKALFIHRNTLVFRLERLRESSGLCPGKFLNHAILCKFLFGD